MLLQEQDIAGLHERIDGDSETISGSVRRVSARRGAGLCVAGKTNCPGGAACRATRHSRQRNIHVWLAAVLCQGREGCHHGRRGLRPTGAQPDQLCRSCVALGNCQSTGQADAVERRSLNPVRERKEIDVARIRKPVDDILGPVPARRPAAIFYSAATCNREARVSSAIAENKERLQ